MGQFRAAKESFFKKSPRKKQRFEKQRWFINKRMCEKITEVIKNNVPQRKTGRDLHLSPSTEQNIIKAFKESGGVSVCKGQGSKPKLDPRDL